MLPCIVKILTRIEIYLFFILKLIHKNEKLSHPKEREKGEAKVCKEHPPPNITSEPAVGEALTAGVTGDGGISGLKDGGFVEGAS